MVKVLFVCLGNICRSPMAEAVFAHLVREEGLTEKIEVDSAGTGDWHVGERPHGGTRGVLQSNGIRYDHQARLIHHDDLTDFDYIITMDNENLRNVKAMGNGRAHIASLMSYAPETGFKEVPDPYYTGKFDLVYDLVLQGARGLLASIRREHTL